MTWCISTALSWALVWHAPADHPQIRPWVSSCYGDQRQCTEAAEVNVVYRPFFPMRAECVEQPAAQGSKVQGSVVVK